jgi:hypothetical protein
VNYKNLQPRKGYWNSPETLEGRLRGFKVICAAPTQTSLCQILTYSLLDLEKKEVKFSLELLMIGKKMELSPAFLTSFDKDRRFDADTAEKLSDICLRPIRCSFGKSRTVTASSKVFQKPATNKLAQLASVAFCIMLFPLTAILTVLGAISLKSSKTHQKSYGDLVKKLQVSSDKDFNRSKQTEKAVSNRERTPLKKRVEPKRETIRRRRVQKSSPRVATCPSVKMKHDVNFDPEAHGYVLLEGTPEERTPLLKKTVPRKRLSPSKPKTFYEGVQATKLRNDSHKTREQPKREAIRRRRVKQSNAQGGSGYPSVKMKHDVFDPVAHGHVLLGNTAKERVPLLTGSIAGKRLSPQKTKIFHKSVKPKKAISQLPEQDFTKLTDLVQYKKAVKSMFSLKRKKLLPRFARSYLRDVKTNSGFVPSEAKVVQGVEVPKQFDRDVFRMTHIVNGETISKSGSLAEVSNDICTKLLKLTKGDVRKADVIMKFTNQTSGADLLGYCLGKFMNIDLDIMCKGGKHPEPESPLKSVVSNVYRDDNGHYKVSFSTTFTICQKLETDLVDFKATLDVDLSSGDAEIQLERFKLANRAQCIPSMGRCLPIQFPFSFPRINWSRLQAVRA